MYGWPGWNNPYFGAGQRSLLNNVRQMMPIQNAQQLYMGQYHQGLEHQMYSNAPFLMQHQMHDISHSVANHRFHFAQRQSVQNWQNINAERTNFAIEQNSTSLNVNEPGKDTLGQLTATSDLPKPESSSNEAINAVNIAEDATKEMAPKNLQEQERLNSLKEQVKTWQEQKQIQEEQQKHVQEHINQSALMYHQAVTQASFVQPNMPLMQRSIQQNVIPHQQVATMNVQAYGLSKSVPEAVITQKSVQPAVLSVSSVNVNKNSDDILNSNLIKSETPKFVAETPPQQKLATFKENNVESQSNQATTAPSNLSVLVKCLRDFEDHLRQWNDQFDEWRRQNKDHPDRQKYLTYEKQWLDWRGQLVQRHLQMKELYHEQISRLNQQNRWKPMDDMKIEDDFIPQKQQMTNLLREQQQADCNFRGKEISKPLEESFISSRNTEIENKLVTDYSSNAGHLYGKNITASKDNDSNTFGKPDVKEQLVQKWDPEVDYENKESEMLELARLSGYVEEETVSSKVDKGASKLVNVIKPSEQIISKSSPAKVIEKSPNKSQNKDSLPDNQMVDANELYDPFEDDEFTVDTKKTNKVGAIWLNDSAEVLLKELVQPTVEPKETTNQPAKGARPALLQTPSIKPLLNDESSSFQSKEKHESNDDFDDRVWKFDDDCYVFFDDKNDAIANKAPELFLRRDFTDMQQNQSLQRNANMVKNTEMVKNVGHQERMINNPSKRARVSRFDQPNQIVEQRSDQVIPKLSRFDQPNQLLESRADQKLPNSSRFEHANEVIETGFNQMVHQPSQFEQTNKVIELRFDKPNISRFDHPVELRSEITKKNIRTTERFTRRTDVIPRIEPFIEDPRHAISEPTGTGKWVPVPFVDEVIPNVEFNKCMQPMAESYSKGDSSDSSLTNNMSTIPIAVGGTIARALTFEEQEIIRQATEELKALQDLKELTKMLNTNVAPCSTPAISPMSLGTNWKTPIDNECVGEVTMGVRKQNLPLEPFSRELVTSKRKFSSDISVSSRKIFNYDHKTSTDPEPLPVTSILQPEIQRVNNGKPFRLARLKSLDYAHGQVTKPVVELNDKPFEDPSRCVANPTPVLFPAAEPNKDFRQIERCYDMSYTSKERTAPRWEPVKEQQANRSSRNESFQNKRSSSREAPLKSGAVMIGDLIGIEGRRNRPPRIVIVLRGPPGSSKSYVAKLIKDKEIENGGSAPRILSLDDYFMVETEKKAIDPETGKNIKIKVLEYEYEPEVEDSYRKSLLRAFKKTIDDGFFPLIIVDAINNRVKHFEELHTYAKQKGFQVYICEMDMDPIVCFKRNIHNRTQDEITRMIKSWEDTPRLFLQLDVRSLLQDASITEVEMEDFVETETRVDQVVVKKGKTEASKTDKVKEDSPDLEVITPSKWEQMDATTERLDKLDGFLKAKRKLETPKSLEHYLQVSDDYEEREVQPGKKRVRWADIEEGKNLAKRRELGFVVGQTNWSHFTDPNYAQKALTRTKYI